MTTRFSPLLLPLLLGACATPAPPAPPPAAPVACQPVVAPAPPPASDIEDLLAYHQSVRQLSPVDLALEIARLNLRPASPRLALQKAMALALTHNNDDLARARAQLAGVLISTESAAEPLKPLARLLAAHDAELQRLDQQAEKSVQQARESQRRIDQLKGMLESLKTIERTLPTRPSALKAPTTK